MRSEKSIKSHPNHCLKRLLDLDVVVVTGASVNTDIGPDSEAQIAPQQDDYDEKEYDQEPEQDHTEQTEINEKNEKNKNGQRIGTEVKTNTPV